MKCTGNSLLNRYANFQALPPGILRAVRVNEFNKFQGGGAPPVPPTAPPLPPVALDATGITQTQFQANWSASAEAASYQLDVATDSLFTSFVAGFNSKSVSGTSSVVTGLTLATSYYYRVRAVNALGTSGNSNTINAPTEVNPVFCATTIANGGGDSYDCYAVGGPYTSLPNAGTAFNGLWQIGDATYLFGYGDNFDSYTVGAAGTMGDGTGLSGNWIYGENEIFARSDSFDTYTVGPAGTLNAGTGFTGDWIYADPTYLIGLGDDFDSYTVGAAGTLSAGTGFSGDWIYA